MATRTEQLKTMLDARTDSSGKAKLGYTKNVAAIRLELNRAAAKKNPGEGS